VTIAIPTTSTNTTASGTSHAVTMPSGINAGDVLLYFGCFAQPQPSLTYSGSWTNQQLTNHVLSLTNEICLAVATLVAAGGDTLTITSGATSKGAHAVYRVTGCDMSSWVQSNDGCTPSEGSSANPDPPTVADTTNFTRNLWVAYMGISGTRTTTSYPANYTTAQLTQGSGSGSASTNCTIAVAARILTTTSDNPGAFTMSASTEWGAGTRAFYASAAVSQFMLVNTAIGGRP
jgi:hypothetical protein